ncbi:T-complex protein gamma SU (nucleomorph) [Bigelowiella natans]|uniref:T-complex protein gamma SU n=1 Tax=Bigelowiella natans TaxID=227086 RepID=Q3LW81_BIGNA|nr:T-complex protein gamma SU [Bigelowiella natans]ABA27285.1 T-complex protein gamma SU [Bigelowiella natans]
MRDRLSFYKNEYKLLYGINNIFKNSLGPKGKYYIIKYFGRYLIMYETKTLLYFLFNKSTYYTHILHEILIHAEEFQDGVKYILVVITEILKQINNRQIFYNSKIKIKLLTILKLILKFVSKASFLRSRNLDIKNLYNQKKFIRMLSRSDIIDFSRDFLSIVSTLIYDYYAKSIDTNHLKSINIINLRIDKSTKFYILNGMIYKNVIKSYRKFLNNTKIAYIKQTNSTFRSSTLRYKEKHVFSKLLMEEKIMYIDLMKIFQNNSINCLLIYKTISDTLLKFFEKHEIIILQPSNVHILTSILSLIKAKSLQTFSENFEILVGVARCIFSRRIVDNNYTVIKQYEYLSNKKCMLVNFSNKGFYMMFKIMFFKLLSILTIARYKTRLIIAGGLLEIGIIRYFLNINYKNKNNDNLLLILLDSFAVIPFELCGDTILSRNKFIRKNNCKDCWLNYSHYNMVKNLLEIFFIKWHSLKTIFLILSRFLHVN